MKENILSVASILNPRNKKLQCLIFHLALSRQTIVLRIGDFSANFTMSLKSGLVSLVAFIIALDESTDIQDKLQLAVFARYFSKHFCVKEKLLDLVALMVSTKGVGVQNAIDSLRSDGISPECLVNL